MAKRTQNNENNAIKSAYVDRAFTATCNADGDEWAVKVRLWPPHNNRMGVDITIDKGLAFKASVVKGVNGLFFSMPSYKAKDGTYKEYIFAVTKECRESLYGHILEFANELWEDM